MSDFRDKLLSEDKIIERLNEGAGDSNAYNRWKYLEKIIDYKGLGKALDNTINIIVPGMNDYDIDVTKIKETRDDIEEFLFGERS